jgi:site-specific recombinase XerD
MRKIALEPIFEEFLGSLSTPATEHTWRTPLRRFEKFLKEKGIRNPFLAQEKELLEFFTVTRRLYRDSTTAINRTALRAFYQWGLDTRRITWSPATRLSKIRLHLHFNPCPLTVEERDRLLHRIVRPQTFEECRGALAMVLGMFQGFRIHEACKLEREHVDLAGKTLFVLGKGGIPKTLPLDPIVAFLVERMLKFQADAFGDPTLCPVRFLLAQVGYSDRPAHASLLHKSFKKTLKECKIGPTHRFHHLRHTYLTSIMEKGGTLFDVMDLGRCTMWTAAYYVKNSELARNRIQGRISEDLRRYLETDEPMLA